MEKFKNIVIIITIYLIVGTIVTSCCTKDYSVKYSNFFPQILENKLPAESDTLNQNDLGIRINLLTEKYAKQPVSFLSHSLYAFGYGDSHITLLNKIEKLEIYSILPFNDSIPENSDITDNFVLKDNLSIDSLSMSNIENNFEAHEYFDIYLKNNTHLNSQQRFLIKLFLSDDIVLEEESRTIWLN